MRQRRSTDQARNIVSSRGSPVKFVRRGLDYGSNSSVALVVVPDEPQAGDERTGGEARGDSGRLPGSEPTIIDRRGAEYEHLLLQRNAAFVNHVWLRDHCPAGRPTSAECTF